MLVVRLTGRPSIEGSDGPRALPGQKPWALLACVLLADRPPTRRALAERIWPETADPLAATRWGLLQVRRALGPQATLVDRDDRLVIDAPSGIRVDALELLDGRHAADDVDALAGGELLEGFAFPDAPALEQWLTLERARVSSASGGALRWAANRFARRDPDRALGLLRRATAANPFDDAAHELTVEILIGRGDRAAAEAYAGGVAARYRAELGVDAPAALARALERRPASPPSTPSRIAPATRAGLLLETSTAQLAAGDYAGAEQSARRAASEAALADDAALEARAHVALAGTLIHTVRGRDREAIGLLDRAIALGLEAGDEAIAAEAERELGWVMFLAAEYGAAESILRRALERSTRTGDRSGAARAATVLGASQSDRTEYALAEGTLADAMAKLHALGDRWEAFAASFLARVWLRTGRPGDARVLADAATERARAVGWLSLLPWTLAVAGEARLRDGDPDGAGAVFEDAYARAAEIGDPCWEAFALRGVALVHEGAGDGATAVRLFRDAASCARRLPDVYSWCEALVLSDLIRLDRDVDPELVAEAVQLTRAAPMPDLLATILAHARAAPG